MLSVEDRMAIQDLYAHYNLAIDAGDADACLECSTSDGTFQRATGAFTRPDELRGFVENRSADTAAGDVGDQQHWNSNIWVRGDSDQARAGCYLLIVGTSRKSAQPVVVLRALRRRDRAPRRLVALPVPHGVKALIEYRASGDSDEHRSHDAG